MRKIDENPTAAKIYDGALGVLRAHFGDKVKIEFDGRFQYHRTAGEATVSLKFVWAQGSQTLEDAECEQWEMMVLKSKMQYNGTYALTGLEGKYGKTIRYDGQEYKMTKISNSYWNKYPIEAQNADGKVVRFPVARARSAT